MADTTAQVQQAMAQWSAGQCEQAKSLLKRILQREPGHAGANQAYAHVLGESGQMGQALYYLDRAARADPRSAEVQYATGLLKSKAGDAAGAGAAFGRAVDLSPGHFESWWGLGNACAEQSQLDEAEAAFRRALGLRPLQPEVVACLVRILSETGRVGESLDLLRAASAQSPDSPVLRSVLAFTLNYVDSDPGERFEAHAAFGRMLACRPPPRPGEVPNTPDPERRLRVGLLSPELREHSVAYFIESFLEHRDRAAVEIVCYHIGGLEDETSRRLRGLSDQWRHVFPANGLKIREEVARDAPDILIELGGLTCPPALAAMARHIAPVQVSYVGYPDTTGMTAMDARLVDAVTDPAGAERWAVEKLVRLTGCFLCYRPPAGAPEPRAPEGRGVVFGSFNNPAKISDRTIALWSRTLSAVRGSSLLLKGRGLDNDAVSRRMTDRFARAGLDPERVRCIHTIADLRGHLDAYGGVDIALDPVPYNGTTTTCEALFMGVPVVVVEGTAHASRVGASLLTAAGLPELIARDEDGYIQIAAGLAAERGRCQELRRTLRGRLLGSRLCDGGGHARALGDALRGLWREWCAGRAGG